MAESTEVKYLDKDGLAEFWRLNKQYIGNAINSKVFVGTEAEYNANKDAVAVGAMVVLTDVGEESVIDILSLQTLLNSDY